jgi:hypothetical protein
MEFAATKPLPNSVASLHHRHHAGPVHLSSIAGFSASGGPRRNSVSGRAMSGRAVSNPQHAQQSFDSGPQLYRDVPELHAVPSPSHSALMDSTHLDDFAFAYHGLPDQSSLVSLADHTHTSQSPTAFPQHQAMSGLAHSGLPFGTLPTGNRSQSMEGSELPPPPIGHLPHPTPSKTQLPMSLVWLPVTVRMAQI